MLRLILPVLLLLSACNKPRPIEKPIGTPVAIAIPLGLPPLPIPADNPPTADTIALGRKLFFDPRLSVNNSISCATCHDPKLGWGNGQKLAAGFEGKFGTRNTPTVINAAYATAQFWDGRAPSLEEQAAGPIANPVEMNQPHEAVSIRLNNYPEYTVAFVNAFGPGPITIGKVEKALASYERTLLSGNSPFDRYEYGGDKTALSPQAIRGLALFRSKDKGNCIVCHSIGGRDAVFSDGQFHNLGVGLDSSGELLDLGRFHATKVDAHKGSFKTPTLRNVAITGPYMHDGSLKTLKDVVDFYAGGGSSNPYLDKEVKPLPLTRAERDDLMAFLSSLTGDLPQP